VQLRPFRPEDAPALAGLAASTARGESDFVLNPLWETPEELRAEFERFGIDPADHLIVADAEEEGVVGLVGFLREAGSPHAGLICPIVQREERGRGLGGRLLRAALEKGARELGIELVSAAVGTRNRAGYALLTALGFRPVRQVYLMRCDDKPGAGDLAVPELKVEQAGAGDLDGILALYRSCGFPERSREQMRSAMEDGRHDHVVARSTADASVRAFVELDTHWPRRPWVAFVGVAPELRDPRAPGARGRIRVRRAPRAPHPLARQPDGGARLREGRLPPPPPPRRPRAPPERGR
jgi:ribosomal protein S18 acetylase RimI-like enzyme